VTGRLDALTVPKMRRVVEIKSIPHRAAGYIPKDDHVRQLNLYVHRVRQEPGYEDYSGTLTYLIKDATKGQPVLRAFSVPYDRELALDTLEAFHDALWMVEGDEVPPRPEGYTPSRFPCAYCVYASHCWSAPMTAKDREVP